MFDFEKPWMAIEEKTRVSFEKELQKELGEEHPLYQKAVRAIARREDGDDVLFLLDPQTTECAVVHLTWQGCRDFDEKWPMAEIFMSLDEFKVKRMLPDHDEFCD
ncbi:MAG: hypothetical protein A4E71_00514 [Smithella sp. PtaU1.Bin162]|nr:MAG: hypothetical protein A4E71_00514 [Smithella sp. PtaU1.Bin162]